MDPGLRIEERYRDNDMVGLHISGWNGAFGGAVEVYVGIGELEKIAAQLQGFPKNPSDSREVFFGAARHVNLAGAGASLRFYCSDQSGHALVEAKIQSDHDSSRRAQAVFLWLPIEAAAIDSFVEELRAVEAGRLEEAQLKGSV